MKEWFYKNIDKNEIELSENDFKNYSGYGRRRIDNENGLLDEYIGFFEKGDIKEGKYRRNNRILLSEFNAKIDDFYSEYCKNDEGRYYRKKFSGYKQGKNGGVDIRPINKINEFIDIEYEGKFYNFMPNDDMGKLELKWIGVKIKNAYDESNIEYHLRLPSIYALDFCGNTKYNNITHGFIRNYDVNYDRIETIEFRKIQMSDKIVFTDLKIEPNLKKALYSFGIELV